MKIKIYKSLAMCTLLLGLAACNDFEEMNTDPYAPVYDPEIIGIHFFEIITCSQS